jgi:hypothetical protein
MEYMEKGDMQQFLKSKENKSLIRFSLFLFQDDTRQGRRREREGGNGKTCRRRQKKERKTKMNTKTETNTKLNLPLRVFHIYYRSFPTYVSISMHLMHRFAIDIARGMKYLHHRVKMIQRVRYISVAFDIFVVFVIIACT